MNNSIKLLEPISEIFGLRFVDIFVALNQMRVNICNIRDEIFYNSFKNYILLLMGNGDINNEPNKEILRKFISKLVEYMPNDESGYQGDLEQLNDSIIRILKIIDECSTYSKTVYFANLSRALVNNLIDINEFFKMARCIEFLTEEDLLFIKNGITEDVVIEDENYCFEYYALGLLSRRAGGFVYTPRAFKFRNYALAYEEMKIWPTKAIQNRPMEDIYYT